MKDNLLIDSVAECKARISAGLCSSRNCPFCRRFSHMQSLVDDLTEKELHLLDLESSKKADMLYGLYAKRSLSVTDILLVIISIVIFVTLILL